MTIPPEPEIITHEAFKEFVFGPVVVPPCYAEVRRFAMRQHFILQDEVIEWCRENVHGKMHSAVNNERLNLWFSDEKEGVHFKLRWSA